MTEENEHQLELLFRDHYERMFRLAFALLHDREEARDVVGEVFSRLWDRFSQEGIPKDNLLGAATAPAYLMRSVRNACLNIVAKKKRDERLAKLLPLSGDEPSPQEDTGRLEKRWQATVDCIDHDLSPQTASVIRMCYEDGCSYRETAEELGIGISAVNKHIVKGLRTLREKLKGY